MGHDDYVFIEYIFIFCFIDFARHMAVCSPQGCMLAAGLYARHRADKIDYYKIDTLILYTYIYII